MLPHTLWWGFVLLFSTSAFTQSVTFLAMGEGNGAYIKCPNGDSILFNFRRIGQWWPPNHYVQDMLKLIDPDVSSSLRTIIGSSLDHPRDYETVLELLDRSTYAEHFHELLIQGARSDFAGEYDLDNDRDLLEILFQDYPHLKYRFLDDSERFEMHYLCPGDDDIEFLLMNSPTKKLPELKYYRKTQYRGFSLKIKNYRTKRSLVITSDIESEEEAHLHRMMRSHHESVRTSILKTSHFKPQREVNATKLIESYNASLIIWGSGCPQGSSHNTPSCELLYEFMTAQTRLKKRGVEAHSVVCGLGEDRKIQVNDFYYGIYSTTPGVLKMDMVRVDLSERDFQLIPVEYEAVQFGYPCAKANQLVQVDGVWEFERLMRNPEFVYDILGKREKEAEDNIEIIELDEDEFDGL